MRFVLADLYLPARRAQMATPGVPPDAFERFALECQRCGFVYIADGDLPEEPWAMQTIEVAAQARLDGECPDHPHAFLVPE